jgi:hypothetical protein
MSNGVSIEQRGLGTSGGWAGSEISQHVEGDCAHRVGGESDHPGAVSVPTENRKCGNEIDV